METQPNSQPTQSPKQSPKTPSHLPLALISVIISGLVFGLAGYWFGNNVSSTQTLATASPTVTATSTASPVAVASPTPSGQLTGVIYYTDGKGNVNQYDTQTKATTTVETGTDPNTSITVSADHTKLVYAKLVNNADSYYVYNIQAKTNSLLISVKYPIPSMGVKWSPDYSYVSIDGGTSTERGLTIITAGGKTIGNISYGGNYYWVNNTELVFNQTTNIPNPFTSGYLANLSLFNASTGKVTVLQAANTLTDYRVISTNAGTIYFSKSTVSTTKDWATESAQKTTYWSIDSTGQNLQTSTVTSSALDQLSAKIYPLLPSEYQNKQFYTVEEATEDSATGMVVFGFNQHTYNTTTYASIKDEVDIAYVDLNKPGSFTILFKGFDPNWAF